MVSQAQIQANLPQLALQEALGHPLEEVNGSVVYAVLQSWHKGELPKHPHITVVYDAKTLEASVANPQHHIIYIPSSAHLTQGITRAILQRNPLKKCILWESTYEHTTQD